MRISPLNNDGISMKIVNLSMGNTSCIHYICLIFDRNKTEQKLYTRDSSNCILFGVCFMTLDKAVHSYISGSWL